MQLFETLATGSSADVLYLDLAKAFDTVPRSQLFYTLLKEYGIGGKALKILQEMFVW